MVIEIYLKAFCLHLEFRENNALPILTLLLQNTVEIVLLVT